MLKKILINILLCFTITVISAILFLILIQWYVQFTGATIKNRYISEPRPQQWISDSEIGYRNKPNYRYQVFGRIDGSTNASGFRTQKNFSLKAKKGVIRIIGIGDSVMEGARVNAEDAFLGILERILKTKSILVETINAGVCGYSSYQERLFFERYVVSFHPDIVLVNFCPNDLFPTEDPFGNARTIYLSYLEKLLREHRHQFSRSEQAQIKDAATVLQAVPDVWQCFLEKIYNNPTEIAAIERIFIEIPILEMKEIADKNRIKFVYVFISKGNERLKAFMKSAGVDYVDCWGGVSQTRPSVRFYISASAINFLKSPNIQKMLSFLSLQQLNPVHALEQIAELNAFRYQHSHQFFIDNAGHPSRKGNAVIAQAIYEHLKQKGMLP